MTNQILFYKNGDHLSICFYAGGLISIIDNTGHSVAITQEELYDILKGHFDRTIASKFS